MESRPSSLITRRKVTFRPSRLDSEFGSATFIFWKISGALVFREGYALTLSRNQSNRAGDAGLLFARITCGSGPVFAELSAKTTTNLGSGTALQSRQWTFP